MEGLTMNKTLITLLGSAFVMFGIQASEAVKTGGIYIYKESSGEHPVDAALRLTEAAINALDAKNYAEAANRASDAIQGALHIRSEEDWTSHLRKRVLNALSDTPYYIEGKANPYKSADEQRVIAHNILAQVIKDLFEIRKALVKEQEEAPQRAEAKRREEERIMNAVMARLATGITYTSEKQSAAARAAFAAKEAKP